MKTVLRERVNGKFELRRDCDLRLNKVREKILLAEDVINTDKSSLQAVKYAQDMVGKIVAEASPIK